MQFNISTAKLKNALGKILSIVEKNRSRPILNFAFIEVSKNILYISASDLEVSAKVKIDLEQNVENPVSFCLNVKNIFDIVKELPSDSTQISFSDDNQLQLSCDNINYSLLIHNSEDFPHLTFENNLNNFSLSAKGFSELINKTTYAISNDDTRPYLNGIFLQEIEGKIRGVATNACCLSLYELYEDAFKASDIDPLKNGIIIPRKGVSELKKLVETFNDDEIVNLSVDNSFLYANANDEYFISIRLISREYPKYQTVIPTKTTYSLKVEKSKIMDAIKRIRIMSSDKSHGIFLGLTNNQIKITANHPSLGEAKEIIDAKYDGKEMLICFGALQLSNIISSFDEGELEFELNNEFGQVIIKKESIPNYLTILMPLKIH